MKSFIQVRQRLMSYQLSRDCLTERGRFLHFITNVECLKTKCKKGISHLVIPPPPCQLSTILHLSLVTYLGKEGGDALQSRDVKPEIAETVEARLDRTPTRHTVSGEEPRTPVVTSQLVQQVTDVQI